MDRVDDETHPRLLVDADVLIDFLSSPIAEDVIRLAVKHFGSVAIVPLVLDEVVGLHGDRCRELGITVLDTRPLHPVSGGPLSASDQESLNACREGGWICVTNDRVLGRECRASGIVVWRGLRLLLELASAGGLTEEDAVEAAAGICASNPEYLPASVLRDFKRKLRSRGTPPASTH